MTGQTATVVQAYRFALDPTPRQARMLASHVGAARFVFNRMLAEVKADLDRYHAGEPTLVEGWSLAALRRTWNAHKNDAAAFQTHLPTDAALLHPPKGARLS